ncbi:MAG: glycoside hydrolase family 3 C-terminal domain-containing protein [bacterium]|nr:glycoside hydrolase family 3 C-terminal domain-containing protein [bacterium]
MKTSRRIIAAALLAVLFCVLPQASRASDRVESLVRSMTLEQKIDFIGGYEGYCIRPMPELKIPQILMADGPLGVRGKTPSTAFPASIGWAASFDTALARRVGAAIGMEARSKNTHIMLGPAMNIHRAPQCGRNFEYLGEDPLLAGRIAVPYIRGLQAQGVMATAKHYAANNQEWDRNNVSSDMDERTLREIYLPAFEACAKEGKVAAFMTSYNLLNGVHASQHDQLINEILKGEWGYDGIVMSDWSSVYDGVAAAKAGLDLEMPSGKFMNRDTLMPAVRSGELDPSVIDGKVRRILGQYERFGFLDNADLAKGYGLDSAFARSAALDAARGGMVLLKNEAAFLPLDPKSVRKIAVIGPNGHPAVTGGGGSSQVTPAVSLSLADAVRRVAGPAVAVTAETGLIPAGPEPDAFYEASVFTSESEGGQVPGLKAEFFSGRWPEGKADAETIVPFVNRTFTDSIPGLKKGRMFVRFSGTLTPAKTGPHRFVVSSDGGFRLTLDGKPVTGMWWGRGESVRAAILSLEEGRSYAVELSFMQRGESGVIRMGYEGPDAVEAKMAAAAERVRKLASESDLVILSLGFNPETETEGSDRTFGLPDEQVRLVRETAAVSRKVVAVLNAGGNADLAAWQDGAKAVLHAWYPGQEGNLAAAEILFGLTNPSGKLPVSIERKWEDNAVFNSYHDPDGDKKVFYSEGVFLGYRHFDAKGLEPLYPFGHGLSYTTFEYGKLKTDRKKFRDGETVTVRLEIKNTGKREGAEAVQLYVADPVSSVPRPLKELKGFAKVSLKPGEKKTVTITLGPDAFRFFHPDKKAWTAEPGVFVLLAGASSRDIRSKAQVKLIPE